MKKYSFNLFVLWLIVLSFLPVHAFAEKSAAESKATFSQAELDQMLAPIALYPDSLLSQILMASTYPGNVAEAVKWSKNNPKQQGDAAVKAVQNKSWDPSVMSLVAFPQVLEMMGKKPDWVQNLGDAFLENSEIVMSSIQNLRKKAKEEGNLKTTSEQKVIIEESSPEIIVIEPADPQVVYVPTYNPTTVYGTWWWPSYYPYYYHPVGSAIVAGITFGIGVGIVNSLWGGCNWGRGDVDIDINRHNNINIDKNKINSRKNNSNWNHNSKNRTAPYRDKTSREKFSNKRGGAEKRQDFRGRERGRDSNKAGRGDFDNKKIRDASRKKAENSLKNRGVDPAKARNNLSGAGGDKIRGQVSNIDRSRRNTSSIGGLSSSGYSRDRSKSGNFSQNRSRNTSGNRSRSSSLSGFGNKSRSSSNFNRGSRSFGGGGRRGGGRR